MKRGTLATVNDKERRHRHILDALARNRIDSQDELQDLLRVEGLETTQSTLSRDLRELGVVKGSSGYRPPDRPASGAERLPALRRAIERRIRSVDWGGNLVVLETDDPRDAVDVASRIRRARLHQTVSALAAESSVLVVARTQAYAREIVRALRDRPRRRRRG